LDEVGSLLSQLYQDPRKSIEDALLSIKGILASAVLTNHADLNVQISLASCLPELIHITASNSPFEDELMKITFQVIVSFFQELPDRATKSFHKRLHILESMPRVDSYVMLLDLECDALVLDHLLASTKDDHSPQLLAQIESILVGILDEANDLMSKFHISILSQSQTMGSPSSIGLVMIKKVMETCRSQIIL